ncbi:MAG: DEAD/DEAH box helicase family protein, partial [Candidatus Eremiobacterota bacterium]
MSKIKFKFDPNQEHQIKAVNSVVKLFDGFSQELIKSNLFTELVPNIGLYEEFDTMWLSGNLNDIQEQNNLSKNPNLVYDDGSMLEGVNPDSHRFPCFTVEMETGTGKTYAYLRTVYELKKHYGFRKFIIVVPSVAIYEGIIKAFEITKEHFKTLYGNETTVLIKYDGQNISCVKNFAVSPYITLMVITIDSFNGAKNKIYKVTEKLPGGKKPYEYIQDTRPILILDEPQNYLSPKSREALRTLKPLFGLNYSATPVEKPNPVYRLTPVDAFKMNLVKKIQVEGITEEQNVNDKNL